MKVYIATRFGNWPAAARAQKQLKFAGHYGTAHWIDVARRLEGQCDAVPIGTSERIDHACTDMHDLKRADALLLLVPDVGGTGMWVEFGAALALGKRVLCVGPARERTLFCELPGVELYDSVEDAVAALNAMEGA